MTEGIIGAVGALFIALITVVFGYGILSGKFSAHEAADAERFARMEEMLTEIRKDIKNVLTRQ